MFFRALTSTLILSLLFPGDLEQRHPRLLSRQSRLGSSTRKHAAASGLGMTKPRASMRRWTMVLVVLGLWAIGSGGREVVIVLDSAWMVIALGCWSSRTIWRPNCRLLSSVGGDTMTYNFVIKCVLSQGRRPLLLAVQRANYHCDRARFEQGVVRRS